MFRAVSIVVLASLLSACSPSGSSQSTEQRRGPLKAQDAPQGPRDLAELLEAGHLELVTARGNGASSGNSVDGALRNTSGRLLKVDIVLDRPLYFRNGGRGQNMIGAMVLLGDGGYFSDDHNSFIELPASRETAVSFVAYCADFDKDNPGPHEHFTLEKSPPELIPVMERISASYRQDPGRDITAAVQVAVWLAQGVAPEEIAQKFEFDTRDLALAREFAGL